MVVLPVTPADVGEVMVSAETAGARAARTTAGMKASISVLISIEDWGGGGEDDRRRAGGGGRKEP